ncbi:MAG: peptide ABC transporter ATP-binding protein [Treponema sp.]|nr:MAG: peptide ABC transporter ATP-binding protein [Treponema sp.]
MSEKKPILESVDLKQYFSQGRYSKAVVHALNGVSIQVFAGETVGLVGETGCGKSTLCRAMMRLYKPTAGKIYYKGKSIENLPERQLKEVRSNVQMIFQDPAESMNSRMNVGYIIEEPLLIQTKLTPNERKVKTLKLLKDVGLPEDAYYRYPHEFSGGQRQRIAIARALALDPEIVVCDEPVSALDVSVQSQVLNLLLDMQKERNLTLLFISHGLNVVKHMSDRVAVMYLGSIMEMASSTEIYENPLHPYTQALIAAIPDTNPETRKRAIPFTGEIPSPINLPPGCPFHMNCSKRIPICMKEKPEYREILPGHFCACHVVES